MKIEIEVNNLPEDKCANYPYLVLTYMASENEWWYYGADYDLNRCKKICSVIDKICVNNPYYNIDNNQI